MCTVYNTHLKFKTYDYLFSTLASEFIIMYYRNVISKSAFMTPVLSPCMIVVNVIQWVPS